MAHPDELKKDGRPFEIFNKEIKISYLDKNYEFCNFTGTSNITPTSYLVVGELAPKYNLNQCKFIFRWDERSKLLDVDPENCSDKKLVERFRSDRDKNYYGHHPSKIPNAGWSFEIEIVWDSNRIFEGIINFNLGRQVESKITIGIKESVQYVKES